MLVLAFAMIAAMDNRYPTRREYDGTLKDIQRRLEELKTDRAKG